MNKNDQFIGIVQQGQFSALRPKLDPTHSVRLTAIPMQAATTPESAELDLSQYEGTAIMVSGHDGGDWIYSAEVIDQAGALLTAVVQQLFTHSSGWAWKRSTNDPDDVVAFLNGVGIYQHPVGDAQISAISKNGRIDFFIFYKADNSGRSTGGWAWKLATDPDDVMNFINGTGTYQHPVKETRICAVSKGDHDEFYVFYR